MRKVFFLMIICCVLSACTTQKPPLSPTQIVDGKSIVIPPEFDVLPQETK